ncbi:MAG: TetR/AcrR family transcriptional regulator [Sneathiellales bacterium]|nr:TetR/AcrR family transcriptional regulator [Sneathiellales bacterium]
MPEKKLFPLTRAAKAEQTKLKIVEAAAACFIAKGFHQSSMRDIANTAGVSLGNLYNHFENKQDLIMAFASFEEEENADLLKLLEKKDDKDTCFEAFLAQYFDQTFQSDNAVLAVEIFSEAMRNKEIHEIFEENRQKVSRGFAAFLKAWKKSEEEEVLALKADFILDLVEGAALRYALNGDEPSSGEKEALLNAARAIL